MPERMWPKGPKEPTEPEPPSETARPFMPKETPPMPGEGRLPGEKPVTIRLDPDATIADLFSAIDKAATRARRDERESGRFHEGIWRKLDPEARAEVLGLENVIGAMKYKLPRQITDEDRRIAALKVVDFLQSKGISPEDIAAYLPIKFLKKKKEG